MGKVRPDHIKEIARKLVERFPEKFTSDFDQNKKMVNEFTNVTSSKIRNRVAGYIVRLMKSTSNKKSDLEY
ncbi:MAG: 30S ribosomal protein S17e [miscellaneous Crenarchaeota group-6 archaeon AD8-1]|nr:MAG: 30S ribosomal protein S17e [miscellaneous Crenarchaeota group-6 archaeon AD8-1]